MNPKENPTEYGKWILQLILDDPENWELVELADGKKLDAIFSEAEILRLTWGLWISRYFVVLIALTRKADQLGWDKATLEAVSKTVERLIATLIPSDSRIVRVGSMITNESEIYYLRSNRLIEHSFFSPAAKRLVESSKLQRLIYPFRVTQMITAFDRAAAVFESEPESDDMLNESLLNLLRACDGPSLTALRAAAMVFSAAISDADTLREDLWSFESSRILTAYLQGKYRAGRGIFRADYSNG